LFHDPAGSPRFKVLATIGHNLAVSFEALHTAAWCYANIGLRDVVAWAADGGILLRLNEDTVRMGSDTPGGASDYKYFLAPEVIRGEAGASRRSDLHALAIFLFYLLVDENPLDGRRKRSMLWLHDEAERGLALDPLFIFHPSDRSNAPREEQQYSETNWMRIPDYIRALFTRSFTVGLTDASLRVSEKVWKEALLDMRAEESLM
jgi:DNA-binding helix-hairpin-helix protein with protein kinase domain